MTELESDRSLELEIRQALRSAIDPPAAPDAVRLVVADLARTQGRSAGRTGSGLGRIRLASPARALMRLAAAIAIVSVIGIGLSFRGSAPGTAPQRGPVIALGVPDIGWVSPLFGWYGPGFITSDGGNTWRRVPLEYPPTTASSSAAFIDAGHFWTAGAHADGDTERIVVNRTTDGGLTWRSTQVAAIPHAVSAGLLVNLHFVDSAHGILLFGELLSGTASSGNCRLYSTDDGGVSWLELAAAPCLNLNGPTFATPEIGYMSTAEAGMIAVTRDGGRTWKTAPLPDAIPKRQVWALMLEADAAGTLHLLVSEQQDGVISDQDLVMFASADGGASWSEQYRVRTPNGLFLGNVSRVGPGRWISFQESRDPAALPVDSVLVETADSGRTWTKVAISGHMAIMRLAFGDEDHGILDGSELVCGVSSCPGNNGFFATSDGGRTWRKLTP
jgi:photosystem II stability/assembly factor-like uncharacterized protein